MSQTAASTTQDIIARHDRYLSHNYPRYSIVMRSGQGVRVEDTDGKQYLDLFAGFGGPILGHCHPDLVEAVTEQANKLWHVGNLFHTEPQVDLAQAIYDTGFGGQSFFCHSGADANEAAIKLARLYGKANPGKTTSQTGRYKVITCNRSFHGRSFGTMVATGQAKVREGFEPLVTGFSHADFNDLDSIASLVDDETVAVMLEPIQGEGGVYVPADDFLPKLRAFCDERDLLLICDEVWTGCGRTGQYFAHQHWGIKPDIMTLAKGVGGGLAVGVMCATPRIAEHYDAARHGVKHATTLGGNCLSMAAAAKIFEVLKRDNLVQHAGQMGDHIRTRVNAFREANPGLVTDVRGHGLFIGIELDLSSGKSPHKTVADLVNIAMDRGLLINGTQGNIIRLAPALVITRDELDEGLDQLFDIVAGK